MKFTRFLMGFSASLACGLSARADPGSQMGSSGATRLWAHNNLVAWCLPFDARTRGPEERIQMLERLGFKHYAFGWFRNDIPRLESEVVALQEHGIDLLAAQCFSE